MCNLNEFRERLKELMFDKDIKSTEFSIKIGVSGQTIRAWLNSTQNISLSNAVKIADFFACSLDYLVGLTDTKLQFTPKTCPDFYPQLRHTLSKLGVTRYMLTKNTKIKDFYFTAWKNGSQPNLLTVMELASILDCSIDYLIGRE